MIKLIGQYRLLWAIENGGNVELACRQYGYGWALQEGFIRRLGPIDCLDFELTALGRRELDAWQRAEEETR